MSTTAVIVGAGLVGPLAACMLRQRGWTVTLLERRSDPRAEGYAGGRSINLALSHRGLRALADAGLDARVLPDAIPMRGRCIHNTSGQTSMQPYSARPNRFIRSVSRGGLNCTLLDGAQAAGASVRFEADISTVDCTAGCVTLTDGTTFDGDLILGADGAGSHVRRAMLDAGTTRIRHEMLDHGYKELTIPPSADGTWQLHKESLHIWPRGGSMMIALPNPDGSFTCTVFWPLEGAPASFASGDASTVAAAYPDAAALMPTLQEDWDANPVGSLGTVWCDTWHSGRALLIGDAAHAIVPFYGQGMNAGFEDIRLLGEALDRGEDLASFARSRKVDADAIAHLALHNFVEMRDHTGSPSFARRQRRRQRLSRIFPWMTTVYERVTFTDTPYAQALRTLRNESSST